MSVCNGIHGSPNKPGDAIPNIVRLQNKHLSELKHDFLYHLNLDTCNYDFPRMFGDVQFVVMGGCSRRMHRFAKFIQNHLKVDLPAGVGLVNISEKANRYSMFKVGPVLSVSHGIGSPSLSILLQELFKLLHYAKCKDVTFIRIGTCGLLGLEPGSLVITNQVFDSQLRTEFERVCLGKAYNTRADFDQQFVHEIKKIGEQKLDNIFLGATMAANDFYEEQGRMDGPTCSFTSEQRLEFLNLLQSKGILNIEMEAMTFAGLCRQVNVNFAVICVGILNRLNGDQVCIDEIQYQQFTDRLFTMVGELIAHKLDTA